MNFSKNNNLFRPLLLHHSLVTNDKRLTWEEKLKKVRTELEEVIATGHGGVVTNVAHFIYTEEHGRQLIPDYLNHEEHWELLVEAVKMCKEMGLRVWIYDENGYPSGGAGGIVIDDHPEYEAYGLVCLEYPVSPTKHLVVDLPYGHEKVVSAYAISDSEFSEEAYNNRIDLSEYVDENGTLIWDATIHGTVYYIVTKTLYEGVHGERNYYEQRRFPDVLDKDAIKYFIDVTYEKYKKYLGEYFGNTIEAFFTDEPSIFGRLLCVLDKPPVAIRDIPDPKIPLYAHVVWSRNFTEEFKKRKGYDIMDYIPMLFKGYSQKAREVRIDYSDVVLTLYEEAYYIAIEEFCNENNVDFSGHMLGDDWLELNVIDELDCFRLLKHMHIPGIDVLNTIPKHITVSPLLLKIATSVAHCYGRRWVMSESSGFSQDGEFDYELLFGALATQYANGVNVITSYYGKTALPQSDFKTAYDGVARMGELLDGGVHKAPLMVYYPAEDCWQYNLPSDQIYGFYDLNERYMNCCRSFEKVIKLFMKQKVDYDVINRETLEKCEMKNGKIVNPFGEEFEALYLSAFDFENTKIKDTLSSLSASGALIYLESSELTNTDAFKEFVNCNKNIIVVDDCEKALEDIYNRDIQDIKVDGDYDSSIIYIHKFIDGEDRYMFVNTSQNEMNINVTFKHTTTPKIYNVKYDKDIEAKVITNTTTTTVPLTLGKFDAQFVIF